MPNATVTTYLKDDKYEFYLKHKNKYNSICRESLKKAVDEDFTKVGTESEFKNL